jgi:hypothetical protein
MKIVVFLAILVGLVLYALCGLKYFYRTADNIDILQCNVKDFKSEMLDERQLLVCRELLQLQTFANAATNASNTTDGELYGELCACQTPLCWTAPVKYSRSHEEQTGSIVRGWHAHWLIFQLRGTRRIALYHPSTNLPERYSATLSPTAHQEVWKEVNDNAETVPSVEIIMREGDGLFVPTGWFMAVSAFSPDTVSGEMAWNAYLPEFIHSFNTPRASISVRQQSTIRGK